MSLLFGPQITIGPLLARWPAVKRRDFYARMADEADVDVVYVGEVACAKREPLFANDLDAVVRRLVRAGKRVVRSTLALMTLDRELASARELAEAGAVVEANDPACLQAVADWPHVAGPYINVVGAETQDGLIAGGAVRIVYPADIAAQVLAALVGRSLIESELLVFGRRPPGAAARCVHTRTRGLPREECQFVCGVASDEPKTVPDGQGLTIDGARTLSAAYLVLLPDLAALRAIGVTHFRLSPQDVDMVAVSALHRAVLEEQQSPAEAAAALRKLTGEAPWQSGFLHGRDGAAERVMMDG
jgi:collagenase-like PrtC family protease